MTLKTTKEQKYSIGYYCQSCKQTQWHYDKFDDGFFECCVCNAVEPVLRSVLWDNGENIEDGRP